MKNILAVAGITLFIASCNSGKTKEETTTNKDTAAVTAPDTASHSVLKDTVASEPDLGGVGDLTLGLTQTKVTELLGQPDSKGKAEEWGADGLMHQNWMYKAKGITLNMDSNKNLAEQTVFSITITSPCTFKTKRNIGIGSTYKEVMAVYGKDIDDYTTNKTSITIGSIYGGIMIDFTNDKATKIFVGAGAE